MLVSKRGEGHHHHQQRVLGAIISIATCKANKIILIKRVGSGAHASGFDGYLVGWLDGIIIMKVQIRLKSKSLSYQIRLFMLFDRHCHVKKMGLVEWNKLWSSIAHALHMIKCK